ncbi:MAG: hypothetical protein K8T26_10420 [Lentisphaerae bacterium]|nr:hypothetical protein [Lentisphaerota bacterium]
MAAGLALTATTASGAVSLTTATGGSSISANTAGGTYTALTGPVVSEGANRDIGTGTIVLNAPSGFVFDTSAAVSVAVTRLDAGSGALLILSSPNATVTASTITITVSSQDSNGGSPKARSRLTWSGIKVRPTAGTPLATGNITKSGTSSGITAGTNMGALTEVAGPASTLAFTTPPADTMSGQTMANVVVQIQDQFGNNVSQSGTAITLALSGSSLYSGTATRTTDATGKATFNDLVIRQIGSGLTFAASGASLTGATSTSFTISQATLTVSGITANGKTYDGNTSATVNTGSAALVGVLSGDAVTLNTGSAVGAFATETAGTGKIVTVSGLSLSGANAGNYSLTQPSTTANITVKALTVSGVTASSKTYDGNTTATLNTGSAALVGVVSGDSVTLSVAGATGSFVNEIVGTGKAVSVSGLSISGTDATNYSLTQPSTTADITARALTVSATGISRVYDGTTAATVTLSDNRLGGDSLTTSYAAANFADPFVGTGKPVTVTGIAISGTDSGNYTANATALATATITAKPLTVTGITAGNKTYDATTTATVDTGSMSLVGVIGGDTVTISANSPVGTFADKHAGTGKTVTIIGLTLAGDDSDNYSLTPPTTTATITALPVIVSGMREYDGSTEAEAGILTLDNDLDGASLSLSGSVTLAGRNVGDQNALARTVARVQTATGNSGSGAAAFTVTLGSTPVTGNSLVAVISTRGTSANRVTAVTQTGVIWSRVSQAANGSGTTTEIWYAPNASAAGTAVAITLANSLRAAAVVMEYSGVLSAGAQDQVASATGSSTTAVTGTTPSTSQGNELWIGGVGLVSSSYTLGTPNNAFVAVANAQSSNSTAANNAKVYAMEKIVSATGAAASGGTVSSSSPWSGAVATFKTSPTVLGGSAAGNYTVTGLGGTVTVTARPVTVSGITASNKTYDGTTEATLNTAAAALVGVISPDLVTLNTSGGTGAFADPTAGTGKTVFISGLVLDGADAGNYDLTQPTTTATITSPLTTVQFDRAATTWPETSSPAGILITVSNPSASTITVNYSITDGTADNGGSRSDYTLANGTVSMAPGVTSTTLYVNVVNDARDEDDETFQIQLSYPVNAGLGSTTTHTVTIVDEDPLPEIFFVGAPYTVAEAAGSKTITVIISRDTDKDVRVWYATSDGTAVAGSDFTTVAGNTRWPPPSSGTTKTWTIPIANDGRAEGDQYFSVCLVDTQNCSIPVTSACATVTILDDDVAPTVTSGSGVTYTSPFEASLGGLLTSTGTAATAVSFYWGPINGETDQNLWTESRSLGGMNPGAFSTIISNLIAGQTYYYAAFATNSAGEAWSDVETFIGRGNEAPVILDSSVTNAAVTAAATNYTGPTPQLVAGLPLPTWTLDSATAALGATINPVSGVVTWTNPVYASTPYTMTIVASNAVGVDSASWRLRVVPGGSAVYVSTTGSDVSGEGSPARPFATLTNAIAQRGTLTNIYVAAGTYVIAGNARLNSTEGLCIAGGYSPDFFTHDVATWSTILDGANVVRSTSLLGGSGRCEGLVLQRFAGATPLFSQVSAMALAQCLVRNNAMGTAGFDMQEGGQLSLDRCRFFDNGYANGGNLVQGVNAAWTLTMVNSLFANSTGGARVCEAQGGTVDITAVNCTFYNSTHTDSGVSYWHPSGPSVAHSQTFINCLFWTANNGATPVKDAGTLGTVTIEHCVFQTSGGSPWDIEDATLGLDANVTGVLAVPFVSTSTSQSIGFKPGRASPTRNAGQATTENALVPLTDILGEPRLGQTDIGAFEWTTPDTTVFSFR